MTIPSKGKISGLITRCSELPTEYKTMMYILLDHQAREKDSVTFGLAWPSVDTLAIETGMVEAHCQAVLDNLAFWGFLTVENTPDSDLAHWRFNIQRLGATQPLEALLLRNKIRWMKGLTDREHLLLEVLSRHAIIGDSEIETRVSWDLVREDLPWWNRKKWRNTLASLQQAGVITNVGPQANQFKHWIHLTINVGSGAVAAPLEPGSGLVTSPATPRAGLVTSPATPRAGLVTSPATPRAGLVTSPATPRAGLVTSPAQPRTPLRENTLNEHSHSTARGEREFFSSDFWAAVAAEDPTAAHRLAIIAHLEREAGLPWHPGWAATLLNDLARAREWADSPEAAVVTQWKALARSTDMTAEPPKETAKVPAASAEPQKPFGHAAGELIECKECYDQGVRSEPDDGGAWHTLSGCHACGRTNDAVVAGQAQPRGTSEAEGGIS